MEMLDEEYGEGDQGVIGAVLVSLSFCSFYRLLAHSSSSRLM